MNAYSLTNLINGIAHKNKCSVHDCMHINELINDAIEHGYTVELDKVNEMFVVTGKGDFNVFKRGV